MGRPKKVNAKKSGDLQVGYMRFSFIAKIEQIEELKKTIKQNIKEGRGPQTIKAYMEKKLPNINNKNIKGRDKGSVNNRNMLLLESFIQKQKNNPSI